jgi:hypothetical protein
VALEEVGPTGELIPLGVDDLAEALAVELRDEQAQQAGAATLSELLRLIGRLERPTADAATNLVEPGVIADYLLASHRVLEQALVLQISPYSRYRWLWYLRRTPAAYFDGAHPTTGPYDRALAEALVAQSTGASQPHLRRGMVCFTVDRAAARHIHRLIAGVKALSQIHVLLRFAGKGAAFRFADSPLPEAVMPNAVLRSIDVYDQRIAEQESRSLSALGTTLELAAMAGHVREEHGSFLVLERIRPLELPAPLIERENVSLVRVLANFLPRAMHLQDLVTSLADMRAAGVDLPLRLGAQLLLCQASLRVGLHFRGSAIGMFRYGYFPMASEDAQAVMDMWIPEAVREIREVLEGLPLPGTYAAMRDELASTAAALWPLRPASPLIIESRITCLDFAAAWEGVLSSFSRLRIAGAAANARAAVFERTTQAHIDRSNWAPPPQWLHYRGRTLRLAGRDLTDIDALGVNGNTLLLVSCKSIVYSPEYDVGQFRNIRNVATVVNDAVKHWREIVRFLRENRRGDNFDFTIFESILGVVCTPFVVFTADESALEEIADGLRAAVSLDELNRWLSR